LISSYLDDSPFRGVGYVILLGMGLIMALVVSLLVRAETRWLGTKKTFEWFSTAGRTVKTGLIASSVVSAWTGAATLLQSSTVAYQFGISGPFWYMQLVRAYKLSSLRYLRWSSNTSPLHPILFLK
jgi:Na+/proline symporter